MKNNIQVFVKFRPRLEIIIQEFENTRGTYSIQRILNYKNIILSIFFILSRIFLMFRWNTHKILEKSFLLLNKNGVRVTWTARDALN